MRSRRRRRGLASSTTKLRRSARERRGGGCEGAVECVAEIAGGPDHRAGDDDLHRLDVVPFDGLTETGQQRRNKRGCRIGRRPYAYPPKVSRASLRLLLMQVKIGVSRSVYRLPSVSRSAMTRSRKSSGLSLSNATTHS